MKTLLPILLIVTLICMGFVIFSDVSQAEHPSSEHPTTGMAMSDHPKAEKGAASDHPASEKESDHPTSFSAA